MFHITKGSRLHSFLFSMVRIVSAFITLLTLGFVYTSLDMWFSDKDMSFNMVKSKLFDFFCEAIFKRKSLEFQVITQGLSVFTLVFITLSALQWPHALKVPLYYNTVSKEIHWISADAYELPKEELHLDE